MYPLSITTYVTYVTYVMDNPVLLRPTANNAFIILPIANNAFIMTAPGVFYFSTPMHHKHAYSLPSPGRPLN